MSWAGLEEVVAVADAGSFVRAASKLNVSTSHISRVISRLEGRIGATIFYRTTRHVSLTDTGRVFVEQSRRLIEDRDQILALVSPEGEPKGEVRMTCSTGMGERFVAPLTRRFAEQNTAIEIRMELTNRIIDLVGEGFDLAIRTGAMIDPRLVWVPIAQRQLILCAAPSYLERHGTPETIADLNGHSCLAGTSASWKFKVAGDSREFSPKGRWRCNSGPAVLDAAIAGMGICQLPDFYVRRPLSTGALVPVLEGIAPDDETIFAAYPSRRHLLPKVHLLVEMFKQELPKALAQGSSQD